MTSGSAKPGQASARAKDQLNEVMVKVVAKNPGEFDFHQAVREVIGSLEPVLTRHPRYVEDKILERLVEPDRVISFGVNWVDDAGEIHINRGYRVQMSSSIGPYKGGLRFHPTVSPGLLKFLAFEQTLKNSLTTLPMGGAKGGSDFDPKGRSESEIRRFCQSFMTELYPYIGEFTDVPAGDIGVGEREIGYLFGQYKRIAKRFVGALTGKGIKWGGSHIRQEATGYGVVYFAREMLAKRGDVLEGKTCLVSGSGNVAQFTVEKLIELGARTVTLSDSDGFIHDPDAIDQDKLEWVKCLKNERRGRISEYAEKFPRSTYHPAVAGKDNGLWSVPARVCLSERHPGRDLRQGCGQPGEGWGHPRGRGGEHAHRARGHGTPCGRWRAVRSEQGVERWGCGGVRPGDGPGHAAGPVVTGGSRRTSPGDHATDP